MSAKSAPTTINVDFRLDKETPGTIRFKEVPPEGGTPVIGTLYIKKSALPNDGKGIDHATVTVELH
jgi:hypothetical protein